ncbi:MAG: TonB-dependent receptor domain-containing protein, partial [Gemmatimonadota bacterium]
TGLNIDQADPLLARLSPDSAAEIQRILSDDYAVDPGGFGVRMLENPTDNIFARIDARIDDRHRLVVRHNFARARIQTPPNREPADAYDFGSLATERMSRTNATTVQWFATLGEDVANEFVMNVQTGRSETVPLLADDPLIEVDVASAFEGGNVRRRIRVGGDLFAHANELDQSVVQLRNDVGFSLDDHRLTVGAAMDYVRIRRLLFPGSAGRYVYDSVAALRENRPSLYERNVLLPAAEDAEVAFDVMQPGAFLQDEWSAADGLSLLFGLRLDVPMLIESPFENAYARGALGISTSEAPGAHLLISPRFGFNWRPDDGATQIRGGAGVMSGRPPFAWISNAFANAGVYTRFLSCEGDAAPAYSLSRLSPKTCVGQTPDDEPYLPRAINYLDPDFRFPQDFRASFAVDRRLPFDFAATVEGVYTRSLGSVELEDVNLGPPVEFADPEEGYTLGFGNRHHFGTPTVDGFAVRRRHDRFGPVIRIGNGSGSYSYALSAELRRTIREGITLRAGYAYARSGDAQTLISPDITANFGLTPVRGDPVRPPLRPSLYDRPHKLSLAASANVPNRLGAGQLSVLYVAQSGRPYSYVYDGDANGDGYPGHGTTLEANNDLIYVPIRPFAPPFPEGPTGTRVLLSQLIDLDPCLAEARGDIVMRNACRGPASHRVDLRLRQPLALGDNTLELVADVSNVLNLLNDDWGLVHRTAPVVPLLRMIGRVADGGDGADTTEFTVQPDDPLAVTWVGPVERDPETGEVRARLPHTLAIPESQWQIQLGARFEF